MAHSGWGIEKSFIEGLFTEGWAGFKGATQRCGSTPGLLTPVSGYLLQPPADNKAAGAPEAGKQALRAGQEENPGLLSPVFSLFFFNILLGYN